MESIAQRTPKELTQMFEEISGSADLAKDYDEKKREMETAESDTVYR